MMLPLIISAIENPEDNRLMTEFYINFHQRLYTEAKKYLTDPEDVADVVLEALTRIINKMDTFRSLGPGQRYHYAITTVKNLCYILLKREKLFSGVSIEKLETELEAADSTEETVVQKLQRQQIAAIWQELDIEERRLLEQKYILCWTDAELAEAFGIKPESVRMRLTRAKRKVIKQLDRKGFHIAEWL